MHLRVPEIKHFKGGYVFQGDYKKVAIREEACIGIDNNLMDMFGDFITPKNWKGNF